MKAAACRIIRMTFDGFLPLSGTRRHLWDLWELLLHIILQWDSQRSGWRCFSMCTAPPSRKSFPVLQGRLQCRGVVWVRGLVAGHRTTQEVCGLVSELCMEDVVPLSKRRICLNVDDQSWLARLVTPAVIWFPESDKGVCLKASLEVSIPTLCTQQGSSQR